MSDENRLVLRIVYQGAVLTADLKRPGEPVADPSRAASGRSCGDNIYPARGGSDASLNDAGFSAALPQAVQRNRSLE